MTTQCADCKAPGVEYKGRGKPRFFDGGKFGFAGEICERCHSRHRQRIRCRRTARPIAPTPEPRVASMPAYSNRVEFSTPPHATRANGRLVILSPGFRRVDLTNRAVARLEVAAALRRAKRQPKPALPPPPPAAPCVKCGTTGGKLDRHYNRPLRLSGARFGAPGLHCGRCYNRLCDPLVAMRLVGVAS